MKFFEKLGVFKQKNQAAKGFRPKKVSQQTFILEPLITPSGLVDSVDHAPHPLEIDLHTPALPEVHLPTDTTHPLDTHSLDTHSTTTESIPHPLETTHAPTPDALILHTTDHAQIIATHTIETPVADHQLEVLPFLHSTSTVDSHASPAFNGGVFTVGDTGKVSIDYLFDGGKYQGELAIFNTDGMEHFQPGSQEYIQEAAHRALSNSNLGHVVISVPTEAARFNGIMPGEIQDWNQGHGQYQAVKTFSMNPGEHFGVMLVPNGTVQQVFEHPELEGALHPLFSMSTANPNDAFHMGQIADVVGDGHTFVMEDLRVDGVSDHDYNDMIFQVRGATGSAVHLDDVIDHSHDWRTTDMGKALIAYAKPYDNLAVDVHHLDAPPTVTPDCQTPPDVPPVETPGTLTPIADTQGTHFHFPRAQQPLVGVIDTGFSPDNPDIDYTHVTLGHDFVAGDANPLLQPGEGNEHGTHVLGVIAGTNDNGIGIDGINDQAPIWIGRATGSGHWADSLTEFVNYANDSGQPHAVVNLSLDLTQVNPDGSVTTRYEFTPVERAAIEYARQHDVLIVVSAGNDGGVMSALGQASQEFDNIITVGASDGVDRADYSSFGHGLDILAPGGTIEHPVLSTVGDGVGTMAGTSVATAEVTGAASQVWAANPDLSYRQVIELLKLTATDVSTPNWDADTGAGLLNIVAAVGLAQVTKPEEYDKRATIFPDSWSGEGKVTPSDRAASEQFNGKSYDWVSYTVKSGDTLSDIAYRTMGNGTAPYYNFIAQHNGIANPNSIDPGQVIQVPKAVSAPSPTPTPTPAPTPTPTPKPNVPINSDSPNYRDGRVNPFAYNYQRQCTWYAYGRMLETGLLPAAIKNNALFRGNAGEWKRDAEKVGLPVSSTPTQGARGIVVWPPNVKGAGSVGHVAFLEEVYPDGRIRITESNWPTGSWIKERTLTPSQYAGVSFVRLENAQTNSYYAPPAQPGKQRQYTVRPNDTLYAIALRELGDGNRWREIKKANGSTFTEAEARNLQVGMSVYLPVSYQTGTGKPVVPAPSSTPTADDNSGIFMGSLLPLIRTGGKNTIPATKAKAGGGIIPSEINEDVADYILRAAVNQGIIRTEVALFLVGLLATESSGGDWQAHSAGSSYYGAFQINENDLKRLGKTIYKRNISTDEFLKNSEMQLKIAQAFYDEKLKELVKPATNGSFDSNYRWLKPNNQTLSEHFQNKSQLYKLAYAWLTLAGKDGNGVYSKDYARSAEETAILFIQSLPLGKNSSFTFVDNGIPFSVVTKTDSKTGVTTISMA